MSRHFLPLEQYSTILSSSTLYRLMGLYQNIDLVTSPVTSYVTWQRLPHLFLVHWKFQAPDFATLPTFSEMPLLHFIINLLMKRLRAGASGCTFLRCSLCSFNSKDWIPKPSTLCAPQTLSLFCNLPTATVPAKYVRGRHNFYLNLSQKQNNFYLIVYKIKSNNRVKQSQNRLNNCLSLSLFLFFALKRIPLFRLLHANKPLYCPNKSLTTGLRTQSMWFSLLHISSSTWIFTLDISVSKFSGSHQGSLAVLQTSFPRLCL